MKTVREDPEDEPDYAVDEHGNLRRHIYDSSSVCREVPTSWKLVVPKFERVRVLKECHDNPTAGHLGVTKTTARVTALYYWPGLFRDISHYVKSCESCQKFKSSQQAPPGKMTSTQVMEPWHMISTDFVGPLPLLMGTNSL